MEKNNQSKPIGESFSEFMSGYIPPFGMNDNNWEMRDGYYVQFSLYSDMQRSIAETNETFSARL